MHVCGVADAADELTHHAQAAAVRDGALLCGEIAGDQAQQGRLARPVRADKGRRGAIADPERDVVEQHPAIRQQMADVRDLDMAHADKSRKSLSGGAICFLCMNAGHHLLRRDDHHPLGNMRTTAARLATG